jgi:hypothetical protein
MQRLIKLSLPSFLICTLFLGSLASAQDRASRQSRVEPTRQERIERARGFLADVRNSVENGDSDAIAWLQMLRSDMQTFQITLTDLNADEAQLTELNRRGWENAARRALVAARANSERRGVETEDLIYNFRQAL